MQLTRENIISAAIEILDSYGLTDMTMRRLAKHLDVVPGALYWHIPNKQSLIEAIAGEIISPMWQRLSVEKLSASEICQELRSAMISHRDGAEVVSAALPVGDVTSRLEQALCDALGRETANPQLTLVAATTLLNFTMGATLQEQSRAQLDEALDRPELAPKELADAFNTGLALIMAGVSAKT